MCAHIIIIDIHHHHFCILCGESAVDENFKCGDVCGGNCNLYGIVQYVASYCEPGPLLSRLVRLIITNNVAICDLAILWNVCQFSKEASVCPFDVPDPLEDMSQFISKTSFLK
jgi:hypothetical protein